MSSYRLSVAILSLVTALSAFAQATRLSAAVNAYQQGDFAQARDASKAIIDSDRPDVTDADRTAARLYHAASVLGLGDADGAKGELKAIVDDRPDLTLDAHGFRQEFVQLFYAIKPAAPLNPAPSPEASAAPPAPAPTTATAAPASPTSPTKLTHARPPPIKAPSKTLGYVSLGVGGVATVVGAWTLWRANVLAADSSGATQAQPTGRDLTVAQFTYATVGCFLVAAAGLGFGVFDLAENERLKVSGAFDPHSGSGVVSLSGRF